MSITIHTFPFIYSFISLFLFLSRIALSVCLSLPGREKSVRRRRGSQGGILDNLARSVKDGQRTLRNSLAGLGGPEDLYQYPSNMNRGAAGATFTTPGRFLLSLSLSYHCCGLLILPLSMTVILTISSLWFLFSSCFLPLRHFNTNHYHRHPSVTLLRCYSVTLLHGYSVIRWPAMPRKTSLVFSSRTLTMGLNDSNSNINAQVVGLDSHTYHIISHDLRTLSLFFVWL